MQIILLDKINKLGVFGNQVKVKKGYARNYLIPKGKAVQANKKNIIHFQSLRNELKNKLSNIYSIAKIKSSKINKLNKIIIFSKSGSEGKLFGSVGARDIAKAITLAGINVSKNEIRLLNGVLRTIGEHKVNIQVHSEILVSITVLIKPKI